MYRLHTFRDCHAKDAYHTTIRSYNRTVTPSYFHPSHHLTVPLAHKCTTVTSQLLAFIAHAISRTSHQTHDCHAESRIFNHHTITRSHHHTVTRSHHHTITPSRHHTMSLTQNARTPLTHSSLGRCAFLRDHTRSLPTRWKRCGTGSWPSTRPCAAVVSSRSSKREARFV